MKKELKKSVLFSLNKNDVLKAIVMAFLTALITGLYNSLESGSLPTDWASLKPILTTSLVATLGYLIKNYFTPTK